MTRLLALTLILAVCVWAAAQRADARTYTYTGERFMLLSYGGIQRPRGGGPLSREALPQSALARAWHQRPGWISRFAWAVAVCETGKGHAYPDFRHRTRSYGGAWGWYVGTWQLDQISTMMGVD